MPQENVWDLDPHLAADLAARANGRDLKAILALIARHSLWVDPTIARAVPVVFPRAARRRQTRHRIGALVRGIRRWDNRPAAFAFYAAIGSTWHRWINTYVCHIYPGSAFSPRHFTRLAGVVAVPRTLWAFTDWPPVEAALQRRSYELYRWRGPGRTIPPVPPGYPSRWNPPILPRRPDVAIAKLRRLRAEYPGFWVYRRTTPSGPVSGKPPRAATMSGAGDAALSVGVAGARPPRAPFGKTRDARDTDAELWAAILASTPLRQLVVRLVRRYTHLAPARIVRAVPNPFPRVRRLRPYAGERVGQVIDGIAIATNLAASDAITVALGRPINGITGGVVDHAWQDAPRDPLHFCHLGGLALVPAALASLVDSPPIRALLQRRLHDRTGYGGPSGVPPPPSPLMPRRWPVTVRLTRREEDRAIEKLQRFLRERPAYFPAPSRWPRRPRTGSGRPAPRR